MVGEAAGSRLRAGFRRAPAPVPTARVAELGRRAQDSLSMAHEEEEGRWRSSRSICSNEASETAAGTMKLSGFSKLVQGLNLGSQSAVTLVETDGTMVARTPFGDSLIGKSFPNSPVLRHLAEATSGEFEDTSAIDGVPSSSAAAATRLARASTPSARV